VRIRIICVLLWGLTSGIYAQFATTVELPPGILTSGIQPTSRSQRAINEIQASLIYSMFTKPMFNINAVLEDDEDEEDTIISNKQSKEFTNQLLARILAEDLARKDMLKLKKHLEKQLGFQ
tara:strand:+ start:496 stop:858 length:363 start_codon:yes stop_codon:yes gene_type:complete